MARVTINLPDEYVAAGKRLAATTGTTVSALAARGLRNEILRQDVASLVADGHGALDEGWQDLVDEARGYGSGEARSG